MSDGLLFDPQTKQRIDGEERASQYSWNIFVCENLRSTEVFEVGRIKMIKVLDGLAIIGVNSVRFPYVLYRIFLEHLIGELKSLSRQQ